MSLLHEIFCTRTSPNGWESKTRWRNRGGLHLQVAEGTNEFDGDRYFVEQVRESAGGEFYRAYGDIKKLA